MTDDLVELPDGRVAQVWHGGMPSGPLVMYLHGTPDCRLTARTGDAAAVRAGVHLVAVDRPGYGRSDPAESGLASVADDTVAVADALGAHRFAVLGFAGGGPYALAAAARHPDRVLASGVVAGPAVVPELGPSSGADGKGTGLGRRLGPLLAAGDEGAAVELLSAAVRELAGAVLTDDDVEVVRRWSARMPRPDRDLLLSLPAPDVAAGVREALGSPVGFVRDGLACRGAWEVRPEGVRGRSWLWYGADDPVVPPRHGRWLADRVPGATLVVRAETAHLGTLLLHWDDMLATLRDALA